LPVIPSIYPTNVENHDPVPHARITGTINCPQFIEPRNVNFLIDSGACFTTLLPYDVVTLEIDWKRLDEANFDCRCANGDCFRPRILPNVEIRLNNEDGVPTKEEIFNLPFINVIPPPKVLKYEPDPFSLLGMDVLNRFRIWRWQPDKLFLIK
jgi:predicted aspartyl protease